MNPKPIFSDEVMLLRWAESNASGATVTFQLCDADQLEVFKSLTLAKKGQAGQILMCVLVPMDPDTTFHLQWNGEQLATHVPREPVTHSEPQKVPPRKFPEEPPEPLTPEPEKLLRQQSKIAPVTKHDYHAISKQSQQAAVLCKNETFQRWANAQEWHYSVKDEASAARFMRDRCKVESRSEFDHDGKAQCAFEDMKTEYEIWYDETYKVHM
jgi:hypothetical protein